MTATSGSSTSRTTFEWLKLAGTVLGIVVVLSGAVSGFLAYFATKHELDKVSCLSVMNDDIYRHRTRANNAYNAYLGDTMEAMGMKIKAGLDISFDPSKLQEAEQSAKMNLAKSNREKEAAEAIADRLLRGECS